MPSYSFISHHTGLIFNPPTQLNTWHFSLIRCELQQAWWSTSDRQSISESLKEEKNKDRTEDSVESPAQTVDVVPGLGVVLWINKLSGLRCHHWFLGGALLLNLSETKIGKWKSASVTRGTKRGSEGEINITANLQRAREGEGRRNEIFKAQIEERVRDKEESLDFQCERR